jgi:hypothetical protein
MLQLLPGGQAYLDAAAEEAAGWGLSAAKTAVQLRYLAGCCCQTINQGLLHHLRSIAGQQQLSRNDLVSSAAVRLLLELTLLTSVAVQRQREQHRQQQQQAMSPQNQEVTDIFAVQTWDLLIVQIKALAVTSRSCLPPELLQQAGLQLLQALAAPLQQWQLSKAGDSFLNNAGAGVPLFANTLQGLVTAACGAQAATDQPPIGKHGQRVSRVCVPQPRLLQLCILLGSTSNGSVDLQAPIGEHGQCVSRACLLQPRLLQLCILLGSTSNWLVDLQAPIAEHGQWLSSVSTGEQLPLVFLSWWKNV